MNKILKWAIPAYGSNFRPDTNTKLWLPFQGDAPGSTAKDHSGNGNNGTLIGATWGKNSKGLSVVNIDGTDDIIPLTTPTALSFAAPGTVILWVASTTDVAKVAFTVRDKADVNNAWSIQIGDGATATLTNELITVSRLKGGVVTYVLGYTTATRTELFDGKGHQIAVTCDGSTLTIYLDSVSKLATVGQGSNNGTFTDVTGADSATIGGRYLGAAIACITGTVGEVILKNTALSASDITWLYRTNSWRYQ